MIKVETPTIAKIEKTVDVSFAEGTKLGCKKGDLVNEDEVLVQTAPKGEVKEYDLSQILGVSPKKVKKYLACSLGAKIHPDQILAEKKAFFRSVIFKSPVNGVLEALTEKGVLKIQMTGEKIDIPSPVKGKVEKITPSLLMIKFPALVLKGSKSFGEERWGTLRLVGEKKKRAEIGDLGREDKGKIIVVAGEISQALFHKAEALGVVGLVGGQLKEEETEDLVVLVAGDKEGLIPEKIWQTLSPYQDKKALLSGKDKELVIPLDR